MSARSHAERVLLGRLGAYTMLSRNDPYEITKAARQAFVSKFERDVDPNGVLPLEERLRERNGAEGALHQAGACQRGGPPAAEAVAK